VLRAVVAPKAIRHAAMAVETVDGTFRWSGALGDANPGGTPMRAGTPFFIASVTKLVTATVVLRLWEQGRLELDDSITAHLPATLVSGLHRLGGANHSDRITVRHLLAHTSGLPDYFEGRPRGGQSVSQRLETEGDLSWTIEDVASIVRGLRPHFPPQPADAPRQRARYSDTNYQLLAAVIEAVTGRPFHQACDTLVFEPLGLEHTYVFGRAQRAESEERPATIWFGNQPLDAPRTFTSLGPDGGIVSTLDDLMTFMRAFVRGTLFEHRRTPGERERRWNRFGFHPMVLRTPGWPIEYGLGVMRFRLPRLFTPFRPMPAVIGHSGATGTWLFHCPELDVLLAGTVDQATAAAVPYRLVPKVLRMVADARDDTGRT
jgi:D-alanyl-D-alanine carboxypeptidase